MACRTYAHGLARPWHSQRRTRIHPTIDHATGSEPTDGSTRTGTCRALRPHDVHYAHVTRSARGRFVARTAHRCAGAAVGRDRLGRWPCSHMLLGNRDRSLAEVLAVQFGPERPTRGLDTLFWTRRRTARARRRTLLAWTLFRAFMGLLVVYGVSNQGRLAAVLPGCPVGMGTAPRDGASPRREHRRSKAGLRIGLGTSSRIATSEQQGRRPEQVWQIRMAGAGGVSMRDDGSPSRLAADGRIVAVPIAAVVTTLIVPRSGGSRRPGSDQDG